MYDQNNRYNLRVRYMIDEAHRNFSGDRSTQGWDRFHTFAKRVWFSNGIHHHYSNAKITPECSRAYFEHVVTESGVALETDLMEALDALYDSAREAKKVELDAEKGLVEASAVNFYGPGVTTAEAQAYFDAYELNRNNPVEKGLNSRLVKADDGSIVEETTRWAVSMDRPWSRSATGWSRLSSMPRTTSRRWPCVTWWTTIARATLRSGASTTSTG